MKTAPESSPPPQPKADRTNAASGRGRQAPLDATASPKSRRLVGIAGEVPESEVALEAANDVRTAPVATSATLRLRIATAFAVTTLAFSLVLGVVAFRISAMDAVPDAARDELQQMMLWWGFGGVVVSTLLGAIFAKQIADPIRRLTDELRTAPTSELPWSASIHHNYAELESLSHTIRQLALDVHDRETALIESERKFREAFALVGVGLVQFDAEGRFFAVNRRFCEMLGYPAEELQGKRFSDLLHPSDRDSQSKGDLLDAADDEVFGREKRYVRKDGSLIWAQRSGVLIRDGRGRVAYGIGSLEDVSGFHTSQEALRALNVSLKAIVETSPLAIFSMTPTGVVTLWNPAAEKMFGLREGDVLGGQAPLASGRSRERMREMRARVLAGETLHGFEMQWERAQSPQAGDAPRASLLEVSVAAAPLLGPAGGIVGVLTTCTDITDTKATARRLDEQLRFTQQLLEVIPNPIFYKDIQGRYLGFNRGWEQFHRLDRRDWVGKTPTQLLAQLQTNESLEAIAAEDADALAGVEVVRETTVADGSGAERYIVKHLTRFTGPDGRAAGLIGVLTDITNFRQVTQALAATEGRFQALTESAMDIVTVLDRGAVIRYQSPSVKHLLGYEPEEMIGQSQFDMVHPDDRERMQTAFTELLEAGGIARPIEFRVRARNGDLRILESIGKNCLDVPAVRGIIVNTRDVTERRAIQERIQHLAFHDALTGLPNRSLMQDRISQAIARAERGHYKFAVMFIDIDNFKNINDTLGHDAGDELLCEVARRLTEAVRARDTIARQGGDEFIVLLDQLDGQQGATRVAQKILDALRAAFGLNGVDQHVSGSVGIALFPEDGRDAATLLKNADTAMFHGKALGKNTYQFFTSQMNIAVKRRAAMESNLRAAVKKGDFSLVYQPQIDLVSGQIVAVESLVRWQSEESGTMMPGEFIPLAEETGLINEVGAWVLREACRQNRAWQDAGLAPCRVAVNLSARQLNDKGFIDLLKGTLHETGLDPRWLELEITESQVMRQGEGSVMLLNEIADMGVHLAVDDFGTGYSSLSYLKRLPISKLKIDQSFIRDITVDPNDTAIVVAIINMARSLDLEVIAEGIETAGQLALLRTKGCSVGQGYFFSVPLTPTQLEPLLQKSTLFSDATGSPRTSN